MKETPSLVYFNDGKGRAELPRLIFTYGQIPFEDKRISFPENVGNGMGNPLARRFLSMANSLSLQQIANSLNSQTNLPLASEVVAVLLEAEKTSKKQKISYSFEQLVGTWRLSFVTGTKKAKSRLGIVLGKGRYLPKFVKIQLTYRLAQKSSPTPIEVENYVSIGGLQISLTGPVKFLSPQNIVAFDFIKMHFKFLGFTLYNGYVRGGIKAATNFETDKISKQAFFTYFYVSEEAIAARGKGGGIALWSRVKND